MRNFSRLLLFIIFFTVGSVALATAALYPDLMRYYRYRQLLNSLQQSVEQLESLNAKYDSLLKNIEQNPNLLSRIAPAVIGAEPADPNAVYPEATAEELAAAKQALQKHSDKKTEEKPLPGYLERLGRPEYRATVFLCGCGLVLIAFICFGTPTNSDDEDLLTTRILED